MPPRSARIKARGYLADALARGLCAEVLAKQYAVRAMLELGHDEDTARSAVSQVWREDYGSVVSPWGKI